MKKQLFLIAHNIRSLYNVGSIFRSADCFGVDKIYLTGYTPYPSKPGQKGANPKDIIQDNGEVCRQKKQISKTALGAEEWVKWEQNRDIKSVITSLKKDKVNIYALETEKNTKNITRFKLKFPCAMIVGNEVKGLDQKVLKLADQIISIPMKGKKISLNVSVAAGVGLYELNRI